MFGKEVVSLEGDGVVAGKEVLSFKGGGVIAGMKPGNVPVLRIRRISGLLPRKNGLPLVDFPTFFSPTPEATPQNTWPLFCGFHKITQVSEKKSTMAVLLPCSISADALALFFSVFAG